MRGSNGENLDVLLLNQVSGTGGAALVAESLAGGLRRRGHKSRVMVGTVVGAGPHIVEMPRAATTTGDLRRAVAKIASRAPGFAGSFARKRLARLDRELTWAEIAADGRDFLGFKGSWRVLPKGQNTPDILHAHNLHGGYFDLRALPMLAARRPTVLTMHDAWLLSGHCAHSFACDRWRIGCGICPDLSIPVAIDRDRTAENFSDKAKIFSATRLWVTAPSQWLIDKARASMLVPAAIEMRVIPNGVDRSLFRSGDRKMARDRLGLARDSKILLCAANGIRDSIWKDFRTLRQAMEIIAENDEVTLLAIGEDAATERIGKGFIRYIPPLKTGNRLSDYFRAADLYVHASRADTFPNVVLEALACGTPVVASAVGGVPEQILSLDVAGAASGIKWVGPQEATGVLVSPGDPRALAAAVRVLLDDVDLRLQLGRQAENDVDRRFDLETSLDRWVEFYREMIQQWPKVNKARSFA